MAQKPSEPDSGCRACQPPFFHTADELLAVAPWQWASKCCSVSERVLTDWLSAEGSFIKQIPQYWNWKWKLDFSATVYHFSVMSRNSERSRLMWSVSVFCSGNEASSPNDHWKSDAFLGSPSLSSVACSLPPPLLLWLLSSPLSRRVSVVWAPQSPIVGLHSNLCWITRAWAALAAQCWSSTSFHFCFALFYFPLSLLTSFYNLLPYCLSSVFLRPSCFWCLLPRSNLLSFGPLQTYL